MLQVEVWATFFFFHIMLVEIRIFSKTLFDFLMQIWILNKHNKDKAKNFKVFCSYIKKRLICYQKDNKFTDKIYSFSLMTTYRPIINPFGH